MPSTTSQACPTLALLILFTVHDIVSGQFGSPGNVWTPVNAHVVEPPPLQFHTATVVANFLVVFGGVDPTNYQTSDTTWLLNLNSQVWTFCPNGSIEGPVTRVLHTMNVVMVADSKGNTDVDTLELGLMFGGLIYPGTQTLNDTWLFNPKNCTWTRMDTVATGPTTSVTARAGHGAVAVSNTSVLILGGCADTFILAESVPFCRSTFPADAYVFDMAMVSLGWQEIQGLSGFGGLFVFNMLIEWHGPVKASHATVYVLYGMSMNATSVSPLSNGQLFLQAAIAADFSAASLLEFTNLTSPPFEIVPRPSVIITTEKQQFLVVGFVAGLYSGQQKQQPSVWLLDIANMSQVSQPSDSVFSANIPLLSLLAGGNVSMDGSCAAARIGMIYHGFSFNQLAIMSNQACNYQQFSSCEEVNSFLISSSFDVQKFSFPFIRYFNAFLAPCCCFSSSSLAVLVA